MFGGEVQLARFMEREMQLKIGKCLASGAGLVLTNCHQSSWVTSISATSPTATSAGFRLGAHEIGKAAGVIRSAAHTSTR